MVSLNVNGKVYKVDIPADTPLLWALRDHLDLKGTKYGCGAGESCSIAVGDVQGKKITTIEGLPEKHPVKQAWIKEQVPQCGYCQPGVIMQVAAHLSQKPTPSADQVISDMDNVICRCGTYPYIKQGIRTAIQMMKKEGKT
jgi:isoquinoline 1-oxidoreductase alpha subunit